MSEGEFGRRLAALADIEGAVPVEIATALRDVESRVRKCLHCKTPFIKRGRRRWCDGKCQWAGFIARSSSPRAQRTREAAARKQAPGGGDGRPDSAGGRVSGNGHRGPLPFPPSARVPIVGQQPQHPAGLHFYQVPCLIQRPGGQLEADSFEFSFPLPILGAWFKGLAATIAAHLLEQAPDLPEPKVVPLQPIFLGFVPQEMLDKQAAANAETAAQETVR